MTLYCHAHPVGTARSVCGCAPAQTYPLGVLASPPHEGLLRVADLDGDGHLDVVASVFDHPDLIVFRGFGNGHLGSASPLPTDEATWAFDVADVNALCRAFGWAVPAGYVDDR